MSRPMSFHVRLTPAGKPARAGSTGLGIAVVDPMTAAKHQKRGGVALPLRPSIGYTVYATAMSDAKLSVPAQELIRLVAAASCAET